MNYFMFKVWVNGREAEPYILSDAQIVAAGRIPGNINDMVGIEKILSESIKQQKNLSDVSVEYFGPVVQQS